MPPPNSGQLYGSPIPPGYPYPYPPQGYPPYVAPYPPPAPAPTPAPAITIVNTNTNTNQNQNQNQNVNQNTNVNGTRCDHCRGNTDNYIRRVCGTSSLLWCLGATILTGGLVLCLGGAGAFDRCKDIETLCGVCGQSKMIIEGSCCWFASNLWINDCSYYQEWCYLTLTATWMCPAMIPLLNPKVQSHY